MTMSDDEASSPGLEPSLPPVPSTSTSTSGDELAGDTTMERIEEDVKAYIDEVIDEVMVKFRRSYVDHLRSSISEEFEEGQEALDRLKEKIERLEASIQAREDSLGGEGTGAGAGAGDIYPMMMAIEQQAARVEQRVENLSAEALAIVSSALDVAAGSDGENDGGTDADQ